VVERVRMAVTSCGDLATVRGPLSPAPAPAGCPACRANTSRQSRLAPMGLYRTCTASTMHTGRHHAAPWSKEARALGTPSQGTQLKTVSRHCEQCRWGVTVIKHCRWCHHYNEAVQVGCHCGVCHECVPTSASSSATWVWLGHNAVRLGRREGSLARQASMEMSVCKAE